MSIRQNLQDNLRQAARNLLNTPTKRYTAMGGLAAIVLVAYALLNQEAPAKPPIPEPIVQGQQLRFPAGHPQLTLLGTIEAKTAESITIELPARLVWNEERTTRIYPAFAGRVLSLNADIGQSVNAGQVLATLASPEFGAAQADTAKAMADAQVAERALARHQTLFEADVISRKELDLTEADAMRARAELAQMRAEQEERDRKDAEAKAEQDRRDAVAAYELEKARADCPSLAAELATISEHLTLEFVERAQQRVMYGGRWMANRSGSPHYGAVSQRHANFSDAYVLHVCWDAVASGLTLPPLATLARVGQLLRERLPAWMDFQVHQLGGSWKAGEAIVGFTAVRP